MLKPKRGLQRRPQRKPDLMGATLGPQAVRPQHLTLPCCLEVEGLDSALSAELSICPDKAGILCPPGPCPHQPVSPADADLCQQLAVGDKDPAARGNLLSGIPEGSDAIHFLSLHLSFHGLEMKGQDHQTWLFSSVQSLSRVQLFATLWTAARQASLSIINARSLLKLMSIKSVMPSNHLILCCPLLFPPSIFPSIRGFSNKSVLHIRWPKYWSFGISPSNEYSGLSSFRMDWLKLLAAQGTLKSLLPYHSHHGCLRKLK